MTGNLEALPEEGNEGIGTFRLLRFKPHLQWHIQNFFLVGHEKLW